MFRSAIQWIVAIVVVSSVGVAVPAAAEKMRVVDVPLMEGAQEVSYIKRRGDVRYRVDRDFKTVGNFYAQKLGEQQWRKTKKDNLQRNFWIQTFSKGPATLEVRVDSRKKGSEIRLTPEGMMWAEDDQPSPKDLPFPEDATEFEYNDFSGSIKFKSPSSLKTIVGFLSTELAKRQWTKDATEFDFEHFVRMKFSYEKSTVVIDVRSEDSGTEVSMRTDGLNWDGMKAEIERAEREASRIAAAREKQRDAERMLEARERRNNKPKQGIDQLSKLPNKATVVMDGKTYELTHIIAYEVFQYDQWLTKIVATQKPIKQTILLERLKKDGSDEDEDGNSLSWPSPNMTILLHEDDRPWQLSLHAGETPGHGAGDELTGTAIVEDGRARGTVALAEPGSFFEKTYTAEISFDTSVLTKDSTPEKRIANAPKLANSGKLTIGNRTYNLAHVVAYETMFFDDPMTAVVLSEKPLNLRNLTAALGKKAAEDYFEFTPQVKLLIDASDNVSSVSIWADNMSLGGTSKLEESVVIEDGRARGTARMPEVAEFLDRKYAFEVSFDVSVLGQSRRSRPDRNKPDPKSGGLVADSYRGLPIPEGHQAIQAEGSPFRTTATTSVSAELGAVVAFYRNELSLDDWGDWKEDAVQAIVDPESTRLAFAGPLGGLIVQLKNKGEQTEITLISRDAQAAKAAGLFPPPGQSRLFIANDSPRESTLTIGKQDYKIAAGAGAKDPKTGINWVVAPGTYTIQLKQPGGRIQSEKVTLEAESTVGVIIDESGRFNVIELY